MSIPFSKYHGAGNDFIIIDDRALTFPSGNEKLIAHLCHRRFGIGADGLILYRKSDKADFEMIYFNADGKIGSMCGNGARCIVAYAYANDLISKECSFMAYDGIHTGEIKADNQVSVLMKTEGEIQHLENAFELDTGSPHFVQEVDGLENFDVYNEGKNIRYNDTYKEKGINVNFIEDEERYISMRTYERGVEDETLACGTGTVAVAIIARNHMSNWKAKNEILIKAIGAYLKVTFMGDKIFLEGPAELVFEGEINSI